MIKKLTLITILLFIFNLSLFPIIITTNNYTGYYGSIKEEVNDLFYAVKYNDIDGITNSLEWIGEDLNNIIWLIEGGYGMIGSRFQTIEQTPLTYAVECDNLKSIDTLLKLGANIDKTILWHDAEITLTHFIFALIEKHYKAASFLIKKGANIGAKNEMGETALMYACMDKSIHRYDEYDILNPDIVKSLIKAGMNINNINEVNNEGNTALLYAIYTYRWVILDAKKNSDYSYYKNKDELPTFETIKLLIDNGANVNIRNKNGDTPLSLSKELPEITKLLKDAGAYLE